MIENKSWGTTEPLILTPFFEVHRITFRLGEACSKHLHRHRWNGFYVLSGRLSVEAWNDAEETTEASFRSMGPGECCASPPGEPHRFTALSDGSALEFYWPEFEAPDIARFPG